MKNLDMRGPRCRWMAQPGRWTVRARVERFVEPSLLLLLRERPMHGYELLERLPDLVPGETSLDLGNLYRILRGLEEENVLTSEWHVDRPGPARRTYELTDIGRGLLDQWVQALRGTQGAIGAFLKRYEHDERR